MLKINIGKTAGLFSALLLCAASSTAIAQDVNTIQHETGFYVGGGLGLNLQEENIYKVPGLNSSASYNPGFVGLLSAGYALGNGLRLEIEPGYRYNSVENVDSGGGRGRTQIASLLGNAIYDFDSYNMGGFVPHVGVGAGMAHLYNATAPHNGFLVKGHDDAFAAQAIAGAEFAFTPSLKLGIDYRYFTAFDTKFRVNGPGVGAKAGDFADHSLLFTIRYSFGAPPAVAAAPAPETLPPAQPAPAPAQLPRNYTVYFDFNKADITPDAHPILERAATDSKLPGVTRIAVTGHTDLAGPANYNQKLSERRAKVVADELVRLGVPADEIVTVGKGKSEPAVPTPDGVREPRNRRVEIVLGGAGT